MRKNLTRTGRHSLPVVFMQLFILATGVSAQATGKSALKVETSLSPLWKGDSDDMIT